jgi:inorganic pyrophosphatase
MSNIYFLPSGTVEEFTTIVEIPQGEQNKYEINPDTGLLELDRVLYGAAFYPVNYGFIPSTKADDGDAVDVLLFTTNTVPPMTIVPSRAIGILEMIDGGDRDFKILAVPTVDPRFKDVTDISQLPQHHLKDISDFFTNMQKFKKGEWITPNQVQGYSGRETAEAELAKYLNNYTQDK